MFNFNNISNVYDNKNHDDMNGPISNLNNSDFETLQKARQDIIGELDAIIQYDNHLHSTNNNIAKETWEDIRNEELVHVGELLGLISYLAPYQKPLIEQGQREFEERLKNVRNTR